MRFYQLLILTLFSSCCSRSSESDCFICEDKLENRIVLIDTQDRILKVSYLNSDKIYTPNDTAIDVILSNNILTTLYIQTKKNIDTLVLRPEITYGYRGAKCGGLEGVREIDTKYKIIEHTFDSINIKQIFEYKYILDKTVNSFYIKP
jgi:hypothetical protein